MDKEVIRISGAPSDWFLEAVFVVKDKNNLPKNLIVEAEKIIERYLYNKGLGVKSAIETDTKIYKKPQATYKAERPFNIKVQPATKPKGYSFGEKVFLYGCLIGLCVMMGFMIRGFI